MSSENEAVMFRSDRTKPQTQSKAPEVEETAQPAAATKILVISDNNGIGQMIGTALGAEANTQVDYSKNALADLGTEDTTFLDGYNIVVFEAHPGNDIELHCLRKLTAACADNTTFLAMTAGELTLAYAKELMNAGVDEVLPLSAIRPDLRDTVELGPQIDHEIAKRGANDRNGMIVAVSQSRGGIGASTIALALAYQLSIPPKVKKKETPPPTKRVAIVDFDIQNGNLGAFLDIDDNGNVIEMLRREILVNGEDVKDMVVPYSETLDVIPSPVEFAPLDSLTPEVVATLLDELRYAYDIVVLGLPRVVSAWLEPVLARTDQMLLLTDTSVPSVRQSRRLIDLYTEDHVSMPIEVIVAMEKKKFSLSTAQKEAATLLNATFTHWLPRDDAAAKLANDHGKPVPEIAPRSSLSKALNSLCEVIEKSQSSTIRRRA